MRKSPFIPGRVLLIGLLVLVGAVALVAYLRPAWAIEPLRAAAEQALLDFGVGIVPIVLWLATVLGLLRYRFRTLVRRWRLAVGSAALIVAVQGALAYRNAQLPLAGWGPLGGALGLQVVGGNELLGYVRIGAVAIVGVWIMAPAASGKVLKALGIGALHAGQHALIGARYVGEGARAVARAYRRAPLHRALFWPARWAAAAWQARPRRAPKASPIPQQELSGELDAYLSAAFEDGSDSDAGEEAVGREPRALPAPAEEARPQLSAPADTPRLRSPKVPSQEIATPAPAGARPPLQLGLWMLPQTALLSSSATSPAITQEHRATAEVIEEALAQHGVEVRVAEIRPGPTVTMYGLVPGWNRRGAARGRAQAESSEDDAKSSRNRVKVDSILAREKDLALALAAPSLRIEAPVPGESVVGVEVPNKAPYMVSIRSVMESDEYQEMVGKGGLPVALGVATAGEAVAIDLLRMPHLLIAGATGSGKSVCINSVISSLITHQTPDRVRLLLVDPKRVELTPYNGIPHLVTPVIVEPDRVVRLLRGAIQEMLRRYKLLEEAGVRNIQSYNRSPKTTEPIPYFVICIDELADLMMTSSFDVEQAICRLAQLGRATGIHMVVATQRPSVDVVTGLIKANFPSRISFAVASQVDSRTILDTVGAERLLGRGDMLFLSADAAKPRRVQGVYISEQETEVLAEHWRGQQGPLPADIPLEELARRAETAAVESERDDASGDEHGSLYERAIQLAAAQRQLSTSLLQRRLRIGYPRAARLMDQLEEEGIVAPNSEPGKPRDVLYTPDL